MTKRRFAELGPEEVLGLAIDVEKSNAARFATVRDFFCNQDPTVHAVFDELHQEELDHLQILERTVATMFPRGVPQISEQDVVEVVEAVDVDDGEHAIFDDITREDALRMAIDSERYAKELYRRAFEQTADPTLKNLYKVLWELESGHEETLQSMLEQGKG